MSEKGKKNYENSKKEKFLTIGVIGKSKQGKSFILNKISNIDLKIGTCNQTNGISVSYQNVILLDSAGLEKPVLKDSEEKKIIEEKIKIMILKKKQRIEL